MTKAVHESCIDWAYGFRGLRSMTDRRRQKHLRAHILIYKQEAVRVNTGNDKKFFETSELIPSDTPPPTRLAHSSPQTVLHTGDQD